MSEDCVRPLPSGVEPVNNPVKLNPLIAKDVERQMREMESARAHANVSSANYMID